MPRHDTSLRLPAEPMREALARDEALLDQVEPGGPWLVRGYVPATPAVVVGLGMARRIDDLLAIQRCEAAGVEVLQRRSGGGAVLVDANMVCGAICAPLPQAGISDDVTQSYRWLGERLVEDLAGLGVARARRVEIGEARADVHALTVRQDALSRLLQATCYGALSPYEIVVGSHTTRGVKLVGLAQVRRRHAVLFQFGILLRDQSPLVDWLNIPDQQLREQLRSALRQRTVGLSQLLDSQTPAALMQKIARLSVFGAPWAVSDATPSSP